MYNRQTLTLSIQVMLDYSCIEATVTQSTRSQASEDIVMVSESTNEDHGSCCITPLVIYQVQQQVLSILQHLHVTYCCAFDWQLYGETLEVQCAGRTRLTCDDDSAMTLYEDAQSFECSLHAQWLSDKKFLIVHHSLPYQTLVATMWEIVSVCLLMLTVDFLSC